MQTRYLKRFRMELDFRHADVPRAMLPEGYRWRAWTPRLLNRHAAVKNASFRREPDSRLFPALSSFAGCLDLMHSIARHSGFLPQATWLIESDGDDFSPDAACGTVQGVAHSTTLGSIQNLGVVAEHRGIGLGRALVLKALRGFRSYGLLRVSLDVTAENAAAVELYRSVGFKRVKTTYRELPSPSQQLAASLSEC